LEWYEIWEEYEEEEEYVDDNGETQTRVVTKNRKVWKWYADTPEMDVWTGEYGENGDKIYQTVEGLSDMELLLAIFLEEAFNEFGITDALAVATAVFGQEIMTKAFRWAGATSGTSPLSIALRKVAPWKILPKGARAPIGWPKALRGSGVKMASTTGVGAFVARWLPFVSAAVLAYTTGSTAYKTTDRYMEILDAR
jgi:hypothetical protein